MVLANIILVILLAFSLFVVLNLILINQRLKARLIKLKTEKDSFEHLSLTDPLTGLPNRRLLDKLSGHLANLINADTEDVTQENRNPPANIIEKVSMLLIDIDNFKDINGRYSHQMGDRIIKIIAKLIDNNFPRSADLVCRAGGDEFVVLLSNVSDYQLQIMAENLRLTVEEYQFPASLKVTVSIGVATTGKKEEVDSLFEWSSKAMLKAKENGRNQVVFLSH
jgi:diguanylate cyclase (GGDEF)-like protein